MWHFWKNFKNAIALKIQNIVTLPDFLCCRYDMFNIRCKFAVFEPSSAPRIQHRLHSVMPDKQTNLELASNKKNYKGPHPALIFPEEKMTDSCDRRVLTMIEVPGLPEVSF